MGKMSRVFLITANVGSVFENIDVGLPVWLNELTTKIQLDNPDFVALHFQETGGKDYDNGSYKVIQSFFGALIEGFETAGYNLLQGIVDSDADVKHEYTALASVYFIRKNCTIPIKIWDFGTKSFVPLNSASCGKLLTGNQINSSGWNQKEKFPQHFFPNCEWSRKGFARTRWCLGNTVFDLVNVHLFHDSHNLIAASAFPSPFSQNRQRVFNFTLEKFRQDDLEQVPMFIFGDFNFRVNTFDLFDLLRKEAVTVEMSNAPPTPATGEGTPPSDDATLIGDLVIDAKRFSVSNHEQRFKEDWGWLRAYDFESRQFETLREFDVQFHPTYPFDESDSEKFMKTRCPAWCDRVLFTHESERIISKDPAAEYNLIGSSVCMGDHKPVYLQFHLKCESNSTESPSSQGPLSSIETSSLLDDPAGFTPTTGQGQVY